MPRRKPITIGDKTYEDRWAAAKDLDVTKEHIDRMVYLGRTDFIGRGTDRSHANHKVMPAGIPNKAKPLDLGIMKFPSQSMADAALDYTQGYVRKILVRRKPEAMQRLARRIFELHQRLELCREQDPELYVAYQTNIQKLDRAAIRDIVSRLPKLPQTQENAA